MKPYGREFEEKTTKNMAEALQLPTIDLSCPDSVSTANSIRQACVLHGFFHLINHGIEEEMLKQILVESRKFFSLPLLQEKMKLTHSKNRRGYTALYSETLDPSVESKGNLKESFYIGTSDDVELVAFGSRITLLMQPCGGKVQLKDKGNGPGIDLGLENSKLFGSILTSAARRSSYSLDQHC